MRKSKLYFFVLVVLAAAVIAGPSLVYAQKADTKTLKVGVLVDLSGIFAAAEIHTRDGAMMGMEWVNERGGVTVKGEKYLFEAVVADTKGTSEGAQAAAEQLVHSDKVKFILGPAVPYIIVASGAVTEPAKVLRLVNFLCETPEELSAKTPYTFLVNPGTRAGIAPALDYLVEKFPKTKTIGLIVPQDGAERYLVPATEKEAKQRGFSTVTTVLWGHDTVDFYPKITQLLAAKPDAIVSINGYEQAIAQMVKAAREQGFKGPFTNIGTNDAQEILDLAGKNLVFPFANGSYGEDEHSPILTPEIKEVIKKAKAEHGKIQRLNFWCLNGAWLLAQVIQKAQSFDPTVVADTFRKMSSVKTIYGPGKMCGEKTYGIKNVVCVPYPWTEVAKDGTAKQTKWINVNLP
jgi:branched-chain amino acid transport system substrate-binding protein